MARVVLTQPAPRVHGIAERLRALGHSPLVLTLSRIVERNRAPMVRAIMGQLARFDWVVLVSPAAVAAAARVADVCWPASTGVAVVGPGSAQAIADCALPVDAARVLVPAGPRYDAEALIAMAPLDAPRGLRVLVLRGEGGSTAWIARLRDAGAIVETCELYRRDAVEPSPESLASLAAMLGQAPLPYFVLTQVEAVERFEALLGRHGLAPTAHRAPALAIHARIAVALGRAGWTDVRIIEPGEGALASALESPPSVEHVTS
ncbi:MAG: uroporphyrinogen-III synthase [Burkholderiaceae bacterium]|nr:uroporphyrinogen-III synthase [Burkholderiaceae bacterium]